MQRERERERERIKLFPFSVVYNHILIHPLLFVDGFLTIKNNGWHEIRSRIAGGEPKRGRGTGGGAVEARGPKGKEGKRFGGGTVEDSINTIQSK